MRMRARRPPVTDAEAYAQHAGLAHQFEDLEQQQEADALGIWLFLVTEIMFFGGLFAAYAIYRWLYFPAFQGASHILDIRLGAANTIVLLGSSLTMALSVRSAQTGNRRALVVFLVATMILGGTFLGVKAYEYNQKFVEHVVPSLDWAPEGQALAHLAPGGLEHAQLYFFFYFAMTGLRARKDSVTPHYFAPVEVVGLYWHFVDIVWIFLFPLLYLIGGRY